MNELETFLKELLERNAPAESLAARFVAVLRSGREEPDDIAAARALSILKVLARDLYVPVRWGPHDQSIWLQSQCEFWPAVIGRIAAGEQDEEGHYTIDAVQPDTIVKHFQWLGGQLSGPEIKELFVRLIEPPEPHIRRGLAVGPADVDALIQMASGCASPLQPRQLLELVRMLSGRPFDLAPAPMISLIDRLLSIGDHLLEPADLPELFQRAARFYATSPVLRIGDLVEIMHGLSFGRDQILAFFQRDDHPLSPAQVMAFILAVGLRPMLSLLALPGAATALHRAIVLSGRIGEVAGVVRTAFRAIGTTAADAAHVLAVVSLFQDLQGNRASFARRIESFVQGFAAAHARGQTGGLGWADALSLARTACTNRANPLSGLAALGGIRLPVAGSVTLRITDYCLIDYWRETTLGFGSAPMNARQEIVLWLTPPSADSVFASLIALVEDQAWAGPDADSLAAQARAARPGEPFKVLTAGFELICHTVATAEPETEVVLQRLRLASAAHDRPTVVLTQPVFMALQFVEDRQQTQLA